MINLGKKAKNQFGIEDCSPLFPCDVCLMFHDVAGYRKVYPKGMDPNIRPYSQFKTTEELLDYLDK